MLYDYYIGAHLRTVSNYLEQVLPILSRSFVFLIKYSDFDDHIDVILAEPASDPDVAAAPEVPIKVSMCPPHVCCVCLQCAYTEPLVPQIFASLTGGTQTRSVILKPTDTAGMLLASLQSAYGRVVTGITYKGTLLNDPSALMRDMFFPKTITAGFKVQVWS